MITHIRNTVKNPRKKNYATQWHTKYDNSVSSDSIIKDQPHTKAYVARMTPQQWWMDGFKASITIPAYINLGMKNGFGIWHPNVDNHRMPKWLDRGSPLIWI